MQKHHGSGGRSRGFELIGSIPILRKAFRIDGASLEIAIDRDALVRIELLTDLMQHIGEKLVFRLEILAPTGAIEGFGL